MKFVITHSVTAMEDRLTNEDAVDLHCEEFSNQDSDPEVAVLNSQSSKAHIFSMVSTPDVDNFPEDDSAEEEWLDKCEEWIKESDLVLSTKGEVGHRIKAHELLDILIDEVIKREGNLGDYMLEIRKHTVEEDQDLETLTNCGAEIILDDQNQPFIEDAYFKTETYINSVRTDCVVDELDIEE